MACENKKGAKIIVTSGGKNLEFKFNTAPIYASCKNNKLSTCKKVIVYWTVQYTTSNGIKTQSTGSYAYAPVLAIKNDNFNISLKAQGTDMQTACNPNAQPTWQFVYGSSGGEYISGSAVITSIVEQPSNNTTNESGKGILVVDKFGNPLLDDNSLECNWMIVCDDECPPGTCKCPSDKYPGYCCNDCAATAAKIQAITDTLRAFNNG